MYVCGSDEMVGHSVAALTGAGFQPGQVHHEGYGKHWYGPAWRTMTGADESEVSR